jgi:hypothetical protein
MKHLQTIIIIAIVGFTSFALGWFMRGDAIYSAMYQKDLNNSNIENLRK